MFVASLTDATQNQKKNSNFGGRIDVDRECILAFAVFFLIFDCGEKPVNQNGVYNQTEINKSYWVCVAKLINVENKSTI